jgi:hypothetical protein
MMTGTRCKWLQLVIILHPWLSKLNRRHQNP